MSHLPDEAFDRQLHDFLAWQAGDRGGARSAEEISLRIDGSADPRHSRPRLVLVLAAALLAVLALGGAILIGGGLVRAPSFPAPSASTPPVATPSIHPAVPSAPIHGSTDGAAALTGNGEIYLARLADPGGSGGGSGVVPMPVRAGDTCVACKASAGAAWSPDGSTLAYLDAAGELWMSGDGQAASRLVGCPGSACPVTFPGWSGDGRSVVFLGNGVLRAVDVATGTVRTISMPAGSGQASSLGVSRNGRIAFTTGGPATRATVWIANEDGSDARHVPYDALSWSTVALSPDGSRLAVVEDPQLGTTEGGGDPYTIQLTIINVDGTGRRVLYSHPGCCIGLDGIGPAAWSPDGTKVAMVAVSSAPGAGQATVSLMIFDTATGRTSVLAPATPAMPAWRPVPVDAPRPSGG